MPSATADDGRSQLLAQLSAALHERAAVEHGVATWADAVRSRVEVPVEVVVRLTCADGRTVQVATDDQVAVVWPPTALSSPAGDDGGEVAGWWPVRIVPAPYRCGVLLGGPVVGGGSLQVMVLSRTPVDWHDGAGATARGLVDDLRAVLGLALGLEQAVLSVQDVDAMLRSRAVIDQAVGVVMAHHGCGAEQAMLRLRRASQRSGVPVARLAAQLVTDVSGTAPAPSAPFRARRASA